MRILITIKRKYFGPLLNRERYEKKKNRNLTTHCFFCSSQERYKKTKYKYIRDNK